MKIHGLQKMTLLDFPGHVACTVFLSGCDFRCPYCHNYQLACGRESAVMDEAELLAFLKRRVRLLDGVAVTGGEPCLHRDLPDLLRKIRALGFLTKLDTNGYHPELLQQILEEHLADYVAMDIKNSPARYAETIGLSAAPPVPAEYSAILSGAADGSAPLSTSAESLVLSSGSSEEPDQLPEAHTGFDFEKIRKSISILMNSTTDYEFRTTVVREFHTEADFYEIGKLISGARRYYLQLFTDRDTVPYGNLHAPSLNTLRKYQKVMLPFVPETYLRGVDEPA